MTGSLTAALLAAAAGTIVADQGSKLIARRRLVGRAVTASGSGFRWVLNHRGGIVALPLPLAITAWCGAFLGALLLVTGSASALGLGGAIGLGLAVGGAASNLGDRIGRGAVADFIELRSWPTFNLADVALVAGTVILAGGLT